MSRQIKAYNSDMCLKSSSDTDYMPGRSWLMSDYFVNPVCTYCRVPTTVL